MSTTTRSGSCLDQDLLARVAGLTDDAGVLTILARFGRTGAAQVQEGLRRLERDALPEVPREGVGESSGSRVGAAWGRVKALSSAEQYEFTLPAPTETLVQVAPTAAMVPIARAFDAARPVGVVDIHLDRARIVEVGAELRELAHVSLVPRGRADWVELKGPAAPNSLRGARSSQQRERFQHRVEANRARTLHGLSESLGRVARRRGWRSIVLAGDPALTRSIVPPVTSVLRVDRPFPEWGTSAALAEQLRPVLVHARELAVATIAEAARSRPRGFARGIAATQDALRTGRARTIVAEGPLTDPRAAEVIRLALAGRLPVLFANDQLMDHGIVCELHG